MMINASLHWVNVLVIVCIMAGIEAEEEPYWVVMGSY